MRLLRPIVAGCVICLQAAVTLGHAAASPDLRPFQASVQPIPPDLRARMVGVSWNPGCPVDPADLSLIQMSYWGFDNQPHTGTLIIHRNLVADILDIFAELYRIHFPIERMQPYEEFGIGKYGENNVTVGFYCRPDDTDPGKFGMHSYGYAVDINPMLNPSKENNGAWWPAGADRFAPRDPPRRGQISVHSSVFDVFTRHGWIWGGLWRETDYMHFEKATFGAHPNPVTAPYSVDRLQYQGR